ncbi:MAG TPA: peptide chain release factor N(5)-glutamine methyltransferase [Gaiellaceae bacterium]|nr:peptide chain release factor N(5)-glutamine methyltransferase [Gaiellaceae bacterium]
MPLDAVHEVELELRAAGVPSPRVDAEILVADVLGIARSELYASSSPVTAYERGRLDELVRRRIRREPLAYIVGEWGFRRLLLTVDDRALIPRPETEVVVERCLAFLDNFVEPRVLDVGVGSGAIALAIADEHEGAEVVAVDSSERALSLARENKERAGVNGRVSLVLGDLLSDVEGPFDLVVSNPPYVTPEEYDTLQPEIRLYEPYEALVGVDVGAKVAGSARALLRPGGRLVLECGDGQAAGLAGALRSLGYSDVLKTPDLAGRDRVVEGEWRP